MRSTIRDEGLGCDEEAVAFVGVFLAVAGIGFGVAGAVAYVKVQDGYDSLQAFSEQQNVTLSYNEDGQLVDRGETEAPRRSCRC